MSEISEVVDGIARARELLKAAQSNLQLGQLEACAKGLHEVEQQVRFLRYVVEAVRK